MQVLQRLFSLFLLSCSHHPAKAVTFFFFYVLQVGYSQCECYWNDLSYTVARTFHAEAREGSFCCGMFGHL